MYNKADDVKTFLEQTGTHKDLPRLQVSVVDFGVYLCHLIDHQSDRNIVLVHGKHLSRTNSRLAQGIFETICLLITQMLGFQHAINLV